MADHLRLNGFRPITYRVLDIPLEWEEEDCEGCIYPFKLVSLAVEYHGQSQTATMEYTEDDTSLIGPIDDPVLEVILHGDRDFSGITTLFCPPEEDHQVE